MENRLYRYTTNSEGTFSAGRRLLDSQPADFIAKVLEVVRKNKEWLSLPELEHDNLEFYWTEAGNKKYEENFLPIHKEYLPNIHLEIIKLEDLPGKIVYQDENQIGIIATHNKSDLPNPYKK
jgi:hypothetical protein